MTFLYKGSFKVVAIGGGTGLPIVLTALKPEKKDPLIKSITAIVTVSDSGGSSGRLRRDLKTLAPGDIRNCLVALSDAPEILRNLFQYRFKKGELKGHSFGNLFIVALAEVLGDFSHAIEKLHDILAIKGQIFPSTRENAELLAIFEDGSKIKGEENISKYEGKIKEIFLKPSKCNPPCGAIEAIKEADLIVLGPGSLYTSIIPNLLVKEISETIRKSSARKIYILNLVTQPNETLNYKASDHIKALIKFGGEGIIDTILVNCGEISKRVLRKYAKEKSFPVELDEENIDGLNLNIVKRDLVAKGEFIRHDPIKLRKTIIEILKSIKEKK